MWGRARELCYRFYWWAESIIAPSLKSSHFEYENVLRQHAADTGYWLDLGCGHQLLPTWRQEQEYGLVKQAKLLVGLDADLPSLRIHKTITHRVQGDISRLPFDNSSFDLVTSNMVLEHLQNPANQLAEVCRVLRPGGIFVFHTPNVLGYTTVMARITPAFIKTKLIYVLEGRHEDDVFPAYYRINSIRSIRQIAAASGFRVRDIRPNVSSAVLVMIPPLVVFELVFIRLLMTRLLKSFRPNIIAVLQKPE